MIGGDSNVKDSQKTGLQRVHTDDGDRELNSKPKMNLVTVPTTPINTLRDKIKQRLQSNALVKTPQGPGSVIQQHQEEQLQKIQEEVERLKTEGISSDIGPFYGLPSKVQQLLHNHRGITKLYGG